MSSKLEVEAEIRSQFNKWRRLSSIKQTLLLGNLYTYHEFDLYEPNRIIGGIITSPWFNKTGSSNSGGQDRASAELLWLSLWEGKERRVMILLSEEMGYRLFKRFQGCAFTHHIEIIHYDMSQNKFNIIGTL